MQGVFKYCDKLETRMNRNLHRRWSHTRVRKIWRKLEYLKDHVIVIYEYSSDQGQLLAEVVL